jgi:hypothetical protein
MITTQQLRRLGHIVKLNRLYTVAGLNPNTMRSAVWAGRALTYEESTAIEQAMRELGIRIDGPQMDLFDSVTSIDRP